MAFTFQNKSTDSSGTYQSRSAAGVQTNQSVNSASSTYQSRSTDSAQTNQSQSAAPGPDSKYGSGAYNSALYGGFALGFGGFTFQSKLDT